MNEVSLNFQFYALMREVSEVTQTNGGNEVINEFLITWRIAAAQNLIRNIQEKMLAMVQQHKHFISSTIQDTMVFQNHSFDQELFIDNQMIPFFFLPNLCKVSSEVRLHFKHTYYPSEQHSMMLNPDCMNQDLNYRDLI